MKRRTRKQIEFGTLYSFTETKSFYVEKTSYNEDEYSNVIRYVEWENQNGSKTILDIIESDPDYIKKYIEKRTKLLVKF